MEPLDKTQPSVSSNTPNKLDKITYYGKTEPKYMVNNNGEG